MKSVGENDQRHNNDDATNDYANDVPKNKNDTPTPEQQQRPDDTHRRASQFWEAVIGQPFGKMVAWLDQHDGLVTALATVAIAYLTYSLAADSSRQAEISQGQLAALRGQLKEMSDTRVSNNAATAEQMAILRDQAKAMGGQFEATLAAQRPWVTIIPTISSFEMIEFSNSSRFVEIWLRFTLHNDGKEAAQNIKIRQEVIPFNGNPKFAMGRGPAQEALCNDAPRPNPYLPITKGPAILPGSDDSEVQYVEGHGAIPDQSFFLLYGCVDYSFPPDRHGQALFQYVLGIANGDYPKMIGFHTDASPSSQNNFGGRRASIQPSELSFRKDRSGRNEIR